MKTKQMIKFTPYFEWIKASADKHYCVGVTDFAQQRLGEIVYIELPQAGSVVKKDEPCGFVESKKSVVDILAPISGVVVAENRLLLSNPALINASPYDEGWLFTLQADNEQEWDTLLDVEPLNDKKD